MGLNSNHITVCVPRIRTKPRLGRPHADLPSEPGREASDGEGASSAPGHVQLQRRAHERHGDRIFLPILRRQGRSE